MALFTHWAKSRYALWNSVSKNPQDLTIVTAAEDGEALLAWPA